jgi:pyruvate dehydrogenase E1 component alpha subunit
MDVLEVYDTVAKEVERIRRDQTPGFLEIKTYRYKGHSMSDPAKYRTKDELDSYRLQDPILLLKALMLEQSKLTDAEFTEIDSDIRKVCEDAIVFAEKSDEPQLQELFEDVYV